MSLGELQAGLSIPFPITMVKLGPVAKAQPLDIGVEVPVPMPVPGSGLMGNM